MEARAIKDLLPVIFENSFKLHSPKKAPAILRDFQISLVMQILNCTRIHTITYIVIGNCFACTLSVDLSEACFSVYSYAAN